MIQEHEMEACLKRPIEMQVACLMEKFEAVVIENQVLKQELNEGLNEVKQELGDLKREHDQQGEELHEAKEENKFLRRANENLQRVCDDIVLKAEQKQIKANIDDIQKRKIADLEEKYTSQQTPMMTMKQELVDSVKRALYQQREDLQTHTIPLPVPPFYFSLTNVEHYQSNDLAFYSEPFYSHPGGYRMRVKILPNGCNDTKGAYMGLYVSILRGEFDDELRWPFDGSITVQVYSRATERWSNEHTIKMNKEECTKKYVERCVDILGQGSWGHPKFLSLSDLKDNYLKGMGAVRFRVTRVQVVL
jgi:TNF receptor-associated factor 4